MLTVLFSTRNRARLLANVLTSYMQLVSPAGDWGLVVVNNGSTDETQEVLSSFRNKLPLKVLQESRPGKNVALNTGLVATAGDLVVFTDDDVFPRPDWLVEMRRAADERRQANIFGGRILPRWEAPPPDWIARSVPQGPAFAITDEHIHTEGSIRPGHIFGPNMAVRAEVFEAGFRFDETVGPNGNSNYAMGSESEFTNRLARAGYGTWFCPRAVVEHYIRRTQLERQWILNRAFCFGRGLYRQNVLAQPGTPKWLGVPRYLYKQTMAAGAALLREMVKGDIEGQFMTGWEFNYCLGQIAEARDRHKTEVPIPPASHSI